MAARQQPTWLTRALEDAATMAVSSGIPAEDCFTLLNPDSEHDTERMVKKHLLTPAQKQWLFDSDYSLDDVFSGRIEGEQKQAEADQFFEDWNAKLGRRVFGF